MDNKTNVYTKSTLIATSREELFAFHANPENIKIVTPPYIKTKLLFVSDNPLVAGSSIQLKSVRFGIPQEWLVKVTDYNAPSYFTDTQLKGPFKLFKHTHKFESSINGTILTDVVYYIPKGNFLGKLVKSFIHKELVKMFDYRHWATKNYFEKAE